MSQYNEAFYQGSKTSQEAARIILPLVLDLLPVSSSVDVGSGNGPWSSVLIDLGVQRVLAIDGDYVEPEWLLVPQNSFRPVDLLQPLELGETFDLAMCIEVAEHLPESRADSLVTDLVGLAPAVLFSAAVPGQGGTGHINERWQSYWIEKFESKGYAPIDHIRKQTWGRAEVPGIYPQNMFLMVSQDLLSVNPKLATLANGMDRSSVDCVHPYTMDSLWPRLVDQMPLRRLVGETARRIGTSVGKRLGPKRA